MIGHWSIHGHAIISDDGRIAGPDGLTPPALRNEADWIRFQSALDEASVTVLGRLGHAANPNRLGRNRLVLSSSVEGVVHRDDAWWWNPATDSLEDALGKAAPDGGIVAVPGGRQVFDLFLEIGYDCFDLARVAGVQVPDGVPIFSAIRPHVTAEDILRRAGLLPSAMEVLDSHAGVTMVRWLSPA